LVKIVIISLISLFAAGGLIGQNARVILNGRVSYVTAQNIYVKFASNEMIREGDTVFVQGTKGLTPIFFIENYSSISAAGKPFPGTVVKVDDPVILRVGAKEETKVIVIPDSVPVKPSLELTKTESKHPVDSIRATWKQDIRGSLTLASYTNLSNTGANNSERMRYSLSMRADHLADTRFSAESYISFSHKAGEWAEVKDNVFSALKVYSLAIGSDFGDHSSVWLGRKINNNLSNIGAVDGIQAETRMGRFKTGVVVGTRPDFQDYGFNLKLLEYGGFVAHESLGKYGKIQSSLAFFEQRNTGFTDRRFVYFQHDNSLAKNLYLFTSCELDLYRVEEGVAMNKPSLTGLYVSLRYRPFRTFSVFASYDARKNVIYYETFKSYADQLLDEATRQGLQLKLNYRPWTKVTMGLTGSYRYRTDDISPNKNLNGFISITQLPWINATATLSANLLQTSYLDGRIYGLNVTRDFLKGKMYGGFSYRIIDYRFANSSSNLLQNVAQIDLSWRINKKTSLSVNYEITLESVRNYHRIYFSFAQRF